MDYWTDSRLIFLTDFGSILFYLSGKNIHIVRVSAHSDSFQNLARYRPQGSARLARIDLGLVLGCYLKADP